MNTQEFLSFEQVLALITAVGHKRTVLVQGENGIGKTSLAYAMRDMPQFANHIHVDPIDCTQLSDGSVWMPDIDRENGISRELPNERFGVSKTNQHGINGARPVVVCLDEILKAPQYIKNVLAPIAYERRVGNYHLVEGSVVFGCTNLALEGLGDSLQAHLRNRLIIVKMRKPTAEEWDKWAGGAGIAASVRAFVKLNDRVMHSFMDYEPGGEHYSKGGNLAEANAFIFNPRAEQDGYASPRSLHAASDVIKHRDSMDDRTLEIALSGTVGRETAGALASFVRFERDIPDYGSIIRDPMKVALHDNPTAQIVQIMNYSTKPKTRDEAQAVTTYFSRMNETMQTMFCNVVANGSKFAMFCTVTEYVAMQNKNKVFL